MNDQDRQQATDLTQDEVIDRMREEKLVMLTTVDASGKLVSHPMGVQQVTDDGDLYFFIGKQGDQADAIAAHPQVNVAFAKTGSWLSVAGTARFVQDDAKVRELWDGQVEAYFPGGADDPNLGLLLVSSESAQWWGQPGGPVRSLAEMVKSKVMGEKPKGESGRTEL